MDPFLGEIRAVGFNYAPYGWAFCQGQLLSIAQNTALYSILGITYGGDGRVNFALPDLRGRVIVNSGQAPGSSPYYQGQTGGQDTVTLTPEQNPQHTHSLDAIRVPVSENSPNSSSPAKNVLAQTDNAHYGSSTSGQMAAGSLSGTASFIGEGASHDNHMPYLALNYIIALQGVFPQRP